MDPMQEQLAKLAATVEKLSTEIHSLKQQIRLGSKPCYTCDIWSDEPYPQEVEKRGVAGIQSNRLYNRVLPRGYPSFFEIHTFRGLCNTSIGLIFS